jgi:peroxiredoxin Q/BCP
MMFDGVITGGFAMALEIGSAAPDFDLLTDGGGRFRLSDHKGKRVIVYFYPKDDTSGCTKEAQEFTALAAEFSAKGVTVVGVSPDSPKSHDKFRAKYELAITLASDEDTAVANSYGVWVEKSMYGKKYMGIERSTFLVDADGKVAGIWSKVKVPGHAAAVLAAAI